jgi:broad specificity phosphatase PhoE
MREPSNAGADVVWLARHGNRQDFVDPAWRESAARPFDPGLSPDGIVQAQRLARRLGRERITHLFASPFLRTVETAHQVAEVLDLPVFLEPGIAEWMNRAWFPVPPEPLPAEALAERFPRVDPGYRPRFAPAYPETEEEALRRAGRTARALAGAFGGALLLVGHGVSVAGAAGGLLGQEMGWLECALCSLYRLDRATGGWEMVLCGDVSHLEEREAATRFN